MTPSLNCVLACGSASSHLEMPRGFLLRLSAALFQSINTRCEVLSVRLARADTEAYMNSAVAVTTHGAHDRPTAAQSQ